MKQDDFDKLRVQLTTAFPGVKSWLGRRDSTRETLATWAQSLRNTSLEHAVLVIEQMIDGKLPPPEPKEYERLALRIASEARKIEWSQRVSPVDDVPAWDERHRVQCRDCRDKGVRYVWPPAAMHAAREAVSEGREFSAYRFTACAVACECFRGDKFVDRAEPHLKPYPRFNANCMVPHSGGPPSEADVRALLDFFGQRKQPALFER